MPSLWITALREFNFEKGMWCIPRKGSKEMGEVRAIMRGDKKSEKAESPKQLSEELIKKVKKDVEATGNLFPTNDRKDYRAERAYWHDSIKYAMEKDYGLSNNELVRKLVRRIYYHVRQSKTKYIYLSDVETILRGGVPKPRKPIDDSVYYKKDPDELPY